MIIVGDISSPTPQISSELEMVFFENKAIFGKQSFVCNLEGVICDEPLPRINRPFLFNHSSVVSVLKSVNTRVVALANNHVLDLPQNFSNTIRTLSAVNVLYTGASESYSETEKPAIFIEDGRKVFLFNYCWEFLLYHQKNPSNCVHIATISEQKLIDAIISLRQEDRDSAIVVYFHWSFDLETLPFPMYRQFSRALIDSGANLVVGSHSHCVQGGEKYKNGYIVYGLGNFFLPYNTFAGSYLTFPDFARVELAFEWDVTTNLATCHWFEYKNDGDSHKLIHILSEKFEESTMLSEYSPYVKMGDSEYYDYFRKHRRKKFLIPVFKDYEERTLNSLYTVWLKLRARFARKMAKLRIINWQN